MVKIIPFEPKHARDFKRISEEWILEFMSLIPSDTIILNDPQGQIIDQGGFIYMAVENDEAIGTCALVKKAPDRYELIKLGVAKDYRGKGVGKQLTQEVITKARTLGLNKLYLESSQVLQPAINLYKQLGFVDDNEEARTPQCDVQMVLHLQ